VSILIIADKIVNDNCVLFTITTDVYED